MDEIHTVIDFDKELSKGAYNAIVVCLRLKPEERITIITDNESLEIASSLVAEIKKSRFRIQPDGNRRLRFKAA